jgi:Spy/CpxP family protein refolding chaperone
MLTVKKEPDMKHVRMAAAAGLLLALAGCAQHGMGMRAGMMGGDDGDAGPGMGPRMMRGEGPAPGYGRGAEGMHPDMMAGHGMGAMMGGGMGGAMMGGYGPAIPDLTNEQRTQIAQIQKELRSKQWALMGQMHEHAWQPGGAMQGGSFDEQAARQAYDQMAALRKQMFENALQARKRIDSLLTPQQREQWRSRPGSR